MNSFKEKIGHSFEKVFWGNMPAGRIAYFRMIFPLFTLAAFFGVPWQLYADMPTCLWDPPGISGFLLIEPVSKQGVLLLQAIFVIANIFLAVGIRPRIGAFAAAVALGALVGTMNAPLFNDRSSNPMILTYLVLAAAPGLNSTSNAREKQWPMRLIQFNFFFTFFAAGYSKLSRSGWDWTEGENLIAKWTWAGEFLISNKVLDIQDFFHGLLVHLHGVAEWIAIAVVGLELGSLAFFGISAASSWGAIVFGIFQISIFATMYIPFTLFLPLYLAFIPFERLKAIQ